MSCYSDGDLLTYRLVKKRAKNGGFTVFHAVVDGDQDTDHAVVVWNPALQVRDRVPVEDILMHQPQLLAS